MNVFDKSPVRVLERALGGGLGRGNFGVVLARSFGGAGNTVPPMAVNLISLWGIEVAVAFGLSRGLGWGITGIWWGRALANLANGLLLGLWFRLGKWKHRDV